MSTSGNYWQGNFCIEVSPIPDIIVIFGASGDLTERKLIPALFNLFRRNLFHDKSSIIGCSRTQLTDDQYRSKLRSQLSSGLNETDLSQLDKFLSKVFYIASDYSNPETYRKLSAKLKELENGQNPLPNRTFYLATPASLCSIVVPLLNEFQLTEENYSGTPWRHVVLEKPFGHDLQSAEELDRLLHQTLHERQIYRIDHYLGKETVQNILMLRFANIIFEPIWNSHYIDNIQITVAESIGIEHRAGYYEKAGLLRDMFQNHMLEMLSLVAMEMPCSFEADAVRDEKQKLIKSIRPFPIKELDKYIIRAQYAPGNGLPGYLDEAGVSPDSTTETYVAAKILIDNWRWRGVPFYLRSGKRLKQKTSEIAITFKHVPHSIFHPIRSEDLTPDVLVLNVQPEEGMALTIQAKQPGPKLCMGGLTLDFKYNDVFGGHPYDAYERLLLDCMLGDQTLFIRSDVIAASWRLLTPVLDAWAKFDAKNLHCPCHLRQYPAGSWGPEDADNLPIMDGFRWRNL
ncbi:MAG: glucose-6-phosphate dehydrogenase [Victivallaceae bacterium]